MHLKIKHFHFTMKKKDKDEDDVRDENGLINYRELEKQFLSKRRDINDEFV